MPCLGYLLLSNKLPQSLTTSKSILLSHKCVGYRFGWGSEVGGARLAEGPTCVTPWWVSAHQAMAIDGTTYTWPLWDGQHWSSALPGRAFQETGKGGCLIQAWAEELAET